MLVRALLAQIALGRTVSIGPVSEFPDLVQVLVTEGSKTVEEAVCNPEEATMAHVIRKLAVQLGA